MSAGLEVPLSCPECRGDISALLNPALRHQGFTCPLCREGFVIETTWRHVPVRVLVNGELAYTNLCEVRAVDIPERVRYRVRVDRRGVQKASPRVRAT